MKPKTIIGLVLLVGFTSLLLLNFGQQVGGYMNFAQAADTGSRAHVVGHWVKEQGSTYDPTQNVFSFYMRDDAGIVRKVEYPNPKPPNFEDAEKLVVEGRVHGDAFVADHILVKCPSKYNDTRALEVQEASVEL